MCEQEWIDKHGHPNKRPDLRIELRCLQCATKYMRLPCQMKSQKSNFCSRGCRGAWQAIHRNKVSKAETVFFDHLQSIGVAVRRQVKIKRYALDGVVVGTNVAIEFDGDYWHSLERTKQIDARKDIAIAWAGYKLIRVKECEYNAEPDAVVASVKQKIYTL